MDKKFLCFGAGLALAALALVSTVQAAQRHGSGGHLSGPDIGITTRIVGGERTRQDDWPSVLSLVDTLSNQSAYLRHYCGATLIDPYWALTAAHCLFEGPGRSQLRADQLRVVGGVIDLDQVQSEDEKVVANVFVHPGYDNDNVSSPDDIGLIELAEPLDLPVMSLYNGSKDSLATLTAHIVGWGALSGNGEFSAEQQAAVVPIVTQEQCNAPESYDGLIGDRQLCAGLEEGGVDACAGDSGGPMIIGIDGFQVQVGVVSFGSGCAQPGFYGIYTDVATFADWISGYVQADFRSLSSESGGEGEGGVTGGGADIDNAPETGDGEDPNAGGSGVSDGNGAAGEGGDPVVATGGDTGGGGSMSWPIMGVLILLAGLRRRYRRPVRLQGAVRALS